MKPKEKKSLPSLESHYRFHIQGHVAVSASGMNRWKKYEVVSDCGEYCILRVPPEPFDLRAAVEPSPDEAVAKMFSPEKAVRTSVNNLSPAELAGLANYALGSLAGKARRGDGKALWHFAAAVTQAAEGLSQMTRKHPKALATLAAKLSRWPMMRSTHPLNCDPDSWLKSIELGNAVDLNIDKYAKWKPDAAAQFAINLYEHVEAVRAENPILVTGRNEVEFQELLPTFDRDSAPAWFEVAWRFFLKSYPKPETVSELNKLVTSPSKRKSPGRIRQRIQEILRNKFVALAIN